MIVVDHYFTRQSLQVNKPTTIFINLRFQKNASFFTNWPWVVKSATLGILIFKARLAVLVVLIFQDNFSHFGWQRTWYILINEFDYFLGVKRRYVTKLNEAMGMRASTSLEFDSVRRIQIRLSKNLAWFRPNQLDELWHTHWELSSSWDRMFVQKFFSFIKW